MSKPPILSYGLITFLPENERTKVLIYARRNSYNYIEFLKGDWKNYEHAVLLFEGMTDFERAILKQGHTFDKLWSDLWVHNSHHFRDWKTKGKARFGLISESLPKLLSRKYTPRDQVWGFPKGRKDSKETPIDTALREFREETTINPSFFTVLPEDLYVVEAYVGSDNKSYSTRYAIAESEKEYQPTKTYYSQAFREYSVSDEAQEVRWVYIEDAYSMLDNNKIEVLKRAHIIYTRWKQGS